MNLLLQTAIGQYRQQVLEELASRYGDNFKVLSGKEYFDKSIKTKVSLPGHLSIIRNHFLIRQKLLWQALPWREVLAADSVVMEGNPRILSSWVLLVGRKFLRRRSALWMHAWPRAGRGAKSDQLRHVMRSLADVLIVYTKSQQQELQLRMPCKEIHAAPNALYRSELIWAELDEDAFDLLYVGRLVEAKKPELLLQAFLEARKEMPSGCRLVFIGDGPLAGGLREQVANGDASDYVKLIGQVNDIDRLREYYRRAVASVSPGYVGLSVTQSLSFGVPMIIAREEPHSPEIEAARDGFNCKFFRSDSVADLKRVLIEMVNDRGVWMRKRVEISRDCAARYSVERMADGLAAGFAGRTG